MQILHNDDKQYIRPLSDLFLYQALPITLINIKFAL